MRGLEWLTQNIDTLIVLAFILIPIILNAKKLGKKGQKFAGRTAGREPDPAQQKKVEATLETKVRRFFEELVEEKKPKPIRLPPKPAEPLSEVYSPGPPQLEPASMEAPSAEDLAEEGAFSLEPDLPSFETKVEPSPLPPPPVVMKTVSARDLKEMDAGVEALALDGTFSSTPGKGAAYLGTVGSYSKSELRKAILLLEVFGKPKALKD